MPGPADTWWDEMRRDAEEPPAPARSKSPVILGAFIAVAVSAALAWWASAPDDGGFRNPEFTQVRPAAQPVRLASTTADQEQVRRAYDQFTAVYAEDGAAGLDRFSASCRESLRADPRILDYCLAFDLFADTVRPGANSTAAPAALVRAAAPSADPQARIADVQRLMRVVTGAAAPPPAAPTARPALETSRPEPQPTLQKASAAAPTATKPARPRAAAGPRPCRLGSTWADRAVCNNPRLEAQHRRMRQAYERALAAGADPLVIDRAQAEWREARNNASRGDLGALYARRIRDLDAAARAPRPAETPPS